MKYTARQKTAAYVIILLYVCSVSDETDVTFEEDEAIVRRFSCHINMGTEDEAARQLFDRDESASTLLRSSMVNEIADSSVHGYWTTDPAKEVKLRMEDKGAASEVPYTIIDMFRNTVDKFGDKPAINIKRMGVWHHWTYEKYFNNCQTLAKAFIEVIYPSTVSPP